MKLRKIITCVKQVPDPEVPFAAVQIDPDAKQVRVTGLPPVINPYDQNSLEAAIRIKEGTGAEITVLSMGERLAEPVLRNTLAVGADKLVLLKDPMFKDLDSHSTAYVLSTAIKKIGEYDVILTGRQAGDWDSGQTGLILGEILGIPSINLAGSVKIENGKIIVKKLIAGGYDLVEAQMPALITVSSEVGELRYPPLKRIMEARKQAIEVWNAGDLEVVLENLNTINLIELSPPADMKRECRFMEGDSPEEKGRNLAFTLKEIVQNL